MAAVLAAAFATACDVGAPLDVQYARGAAVHIVTSNVGTNTPLAAGQPIELAFDRLLLPVTVTRQTFVLVDEAAPSAAITFAIAYDPVARVVTLTPVQALSVGHTYQVSIVSPANPTDSTGLHAIDGATMDPDTGKFPRAITFQVVAASGTAPATCNGIVGPCMSFCTDIVPILKSPGTSCSGAGTCHNGLTFENGLSLAAGLALTGKDPPTSTLPSTAQFVEATAINRLSIESTQGAQSSPGPPSFHFGQDMPIIDTTTVTDPSSSAAVGPPGSGDPGNSFLLYKVLMAAPGSPSTLAVYPLTWPGGVAGAVPALPETERATLASYIPGREMPLPSQVTATVNTGLPMDSLERLSLWIAQGAPLSNCP